ncbi:MAG: ribonuclease R [Salinivirgaceae bacterium]|nr:ribonuclease R [Salinivirgaceae bacterium]
MNKENNNIEIDVKNPTILNQLILDFLNANPQKVFNFKQVAKGIRLSDTSLKAYIISALEYLSENRQIERIDRGKYVAKQQKRIIEGVIAINKRGPAILTTDDGEEFSVPYTNLNHAFPRDRVRAFVFPSIKNRKPEVEITEIIKRAKEHFVGVIEISKNFAFLVPDSGALPVDIFIPLTEVTRTKVQNGQKVVVKIKSWPENAHNPIGEIEKVLGNPGENNVEMHAILLEFGLPYEFPQELEKVASKMTDGITPEEIAKRRDFRKVTTFTIDPADAKDFDDAISIQKLSEDKWEIGVHIADVTHYIEPGSILDKEAFARATSVYLVDRVVPMLPENLSNGICSLMPGVDKLTYSAVFQVDKEANVLDYWIGRTIINSSRRFSYEEAQERIETQQGDLAEEINACHTFAQILRKNRFKEGAINFDRFEVKFRLDEEGKPIDVYLKTNKESNQLIEEFMLLANRTVATHISKDKSSSGKAKTFIYRIHDKPNQEKLERFAKFVKRFGQEINTSSRLNISKSMNTLMTNSSGQPWQNVIETLAVRSMARAEYSTENIGHYGLAFDNYSHFTSPIRRYPDMMVHRLLSRYAEGKRAVAQPATEEDCKHCNEREILATSAERASIKYKQVEYLIDKIEQEFDGVISGVTSWGIFVELDGNSCEGMVPLQTLEDDYYIFDEDEYCLIGEHHKRVYRLGDKVRIRVVKANLVKKQLDFEIIKSYSDHRASDYENVGQLAHRQGKNSKETGRSRSGGKQYPKNKGKSRGTKKDKKRKR